MSARTITYLALVLSIGIVPRGQAVTTYTCTKLKESAHWIYPTGINDKLEVAGVDYPNTAPYYFPFFIDKNGRRLPLNIPPGIGFSGIIFIGSVNNQGQVVVNGYDPTLSSPPSIGYVSNPDGTYSTIEPPPNTPTQTFYNMTITSINDLGDVSGALNVADPTGVTRRTDFFVRSFTGVFTFFDLTNDTVGVDNPTFLNNAGTVLLGDPHFPKLHFPDGSETPLVRGRTNLGALLTFNAMNNNGFLVGSSFANNYYPFLMTPGGNSPAVVCPDYSLEFSPGAINDNGVIVGSVLQNDTRKYVIVVATPTGFHSGLQLSHTAFDFSPTFVGVAGGSGTISVTSTGVADLKIVSTSLGAKDINDAPGDFNLTANSCSPPSYPPQSVTLAPQQVCAVSFTFNPTQAGVRTAQIEIDDDAPDGPHVIKLSGMALGDGRLQFSRGSWSFGTHPIGQTSGPGAIWIHNPTKRAANFASIQFSGGNARDFAIAQNTCGTALTAFQTCKVGFTFTPTAANQRNSSLTFSFGAGANPLLIPVRGVGSSK